MDECKKLLENILFSIVEFKDEVVINHRIDEMGTLLMLGVNTADMGKVIGREGTTAQAIRTLLRVVGAKNNARVTLKIEEPKDGKFSK